MTRFSLHSKLLPYKVVGPYFVCTVHFFLLWSHTKREVRRFSFFCILSFLSTVATVQYMINSDRYTISGFVVD